MGNWRSEHLFTLKQSRHMFGHYQQQIAEADAEMARLVNEIEKKVDPSDKPLPPDRKKRRKRNGRDAGPESGFDLRSEMYKRFGVDVLQIPGLEHTSFSLLTEIGPDLGAFPTVAHFVSWLGLCPDNDISGDDGGAGFGKSTTALANCFVKRPPRCTGAKRHSATFSDE